MKEHETEKFKVVVIGAGQAGLSVGYFLKKKNIPFVILDANKRVGDSWRNRWDSLRLFTPAKFDGLAGMPFPAPPKSFPTTCCEISRRSMLCRYACYLHSCVPTSFANR